MRYELYLEQNGVCPYSGDPITPDTDLFGSSLQVDHILPRSRSHDNGFDNRVLVFVATNQNKKNQTPYEWLGGPNSNAWLDFKTRITCMRSLRRRKRQHLLDATFAEREKDFLERNLNDTRYISRVIRA